jgi:sugar phosphate isomerase/epimerase
VHVGLNSFAFRWAIGTPDFRPAHPLTVFDLLDQARSLGVDYLELDANLGLDALDDAALRRLRGAAAERRLTISLGTFGMHRHNLLRVLDMAQQLGALHLRVNEDRKHWQPSVADLIEHVRSVLPVCRSYGVTLAVENHFFYGAQQVAEIVNTIDDPYVGVSLDTGNPVARLEGWREAVALLARRTVSVHLKDVASERRGVGFYATGRPLGKGMIDMRSVLASLRAAGRDVDVYLELWMDRAESEAATLAQEAEWVRESLDYARRLVTQASQ